jgi:type II secretory pathway pseudopilin PulG
MIKKIIKIFYIGQGREQGYTLIELIIFIMVLAIGIGALVALSFSLRNTHNIDSQTQALGLAKQRLEIIYANKIKNGYSSVFDPCMVASPPAICGTSDAIGHSTNPSGFVISSSIVVGDLSTSGWINNPYGIFKKATVNITGNESASLNLLLTNY